MSKHIFDISLTISRITNVSILLGGVLNERFRVEGPYSPKKVAIEGLAC